MPAHPGNRLSASLVELVSKGARGALLDMRHERESERDQVTLTLTIPAPAPWINTNVRYHRMAKANLTKQWRAAGFVAARGLDPITPPVRIIAHIYKPRAGRYDPNNLADTTKAIVDGLVDAGLLEDDSFRHVIGPDHRHGGKGPAAITLTITQEDA